MKNNEQLFLDLDKKIKNKEMDILIFDIFDTIILRKVHPEYVKKIFSKKLKEHYTLKISSEELYRYRFDIEEALCKTNEMKGFDLEFNFFELTQSLYVELYKKGFIDDSVLEKEFVKTCEELELEVELLTQEIDQDVIKLAKDAKANNIKIYCLSDFYLTKKMINQLFVYHNINDIFEDIFVSCEYLLTKRSGRLYDFIVPKYFSGQKVAMIGDNQHSDFRVAKEKGLEAFLLDRNKQYEYYEKHFKSVNKKVHMSDVVSNIISKNALNNRSNNVYFQEVAYTLYYFIYLLAQKAKSENIKHLFFLSREGEFLKKIFDSFLDYHDIRNIKTHYLQVSRKSTFIASLDKLEDETFETLFRQYRKLSIKGFLKSLNFRAKDIMSIKEDFKQDINIVQEDLPTSELFKSLLKLETFSEAYEHRRVQQKNNLKEYIYSFDADIEKDGFHIVDAGWKGTMQDHLFRLLEEKVQMNGFYIGLVADMVEHSLSKKQGLVFDYKNPDRYDKVFLENISLFEVMLGASHGSADSYMKEDGKIRVITHEEKEEKEIFDNLISKIQNSLIPILDELTERFSLSHISLLDMKRDVAKMHARIIYSPTKEEVRFFRNLYHYENFGLFQFSEFNQHQSNSLINNTKNIVKFIKNPKIFLDISFWKAASLDDLGLLSLYYVYAKYKKIKIFKGLK